MAADEDGEGEGFYVDSLKTRLTETQERNVRDLRRTLETEKGVIYSRFCGSGKTLAILTYLLSSGLSNEKKALVVAPISALKAWTHNSQTHFRPHVQTLQLDKHNKNQLLSVGLDGFHVVVTNFETLEGAYESACALRQRVLREELEQLSSRHPEWEDSSELAELERVRYAAARERHRQVFAYCREQQRAPTVHLPIPFPELAEKEEGARRMADLATDFLFQREWGWLVIDEAHKACNRENQRHRALLAVDAGRRVATTATICSNGIADFISMLDLVGQTPDGGWKKLCAHVENCIRHLNEVKRRCVVFSPLEEDAAIERLYKPVRVLVHTPLDPEERREYLKEADWSLKKSILARTNRLRQLCDGPAKTRAILAYLERCVVAHGEKAVIFTGFVEYTHALEGAIRKRFPALKLLVATGKTNQKKRAVDMINEVSRHRGSAVFLVTIKIMSLGVDMHFANHALVVSPWWNYTYAEQATKRITRPGQKWAARWAFFVMADTVEEGVDLMAYYKSQLNARLLEGDIDGAMLERITSKRAIQRAHMTAGRLREILSAPASDDAEEDEEDQLIMQAAVNGDTGAILKLFAVFGDASARPSFMDGAGDIMQLYRERFDVVMEAEEDIVLPPGEPIDLSSQVSSSSSSSGAHGLLELNRQRDAERLLRKRKKTREENERLKRERAHLSLAERQQEQKRQKTYHGGAKTTMRIDLFGNLLPK